MTDICKDVKCECGYMMPLSDATLKSYFNSENPKCIFCGKELWNILIESLEGTEMILGYHFFILGCFLGVKRIYLNSGTIYSWDVFEDIENGKLLGLHLLTFGNGIEPVILHSNVIGHPLKQKQILIYGRPIDNSVDKIKVQLRYVYAPPAVKDDLATMLLLDAFNFFHDGNYRYMVTSAHSSVEILQYKFIEKALINNGVSKKNTKSFLERGATYSFRLKALLPFITKIKNIPELNDKIYDGLEHLRKDRNALIHEGITDLSDIKRLKEELIAAFLAHQYFKIYSTYL